MEKKDIIVNDGRSIQQTTLETFTEIAKNTERGVHIQNPLFKGIVDVDTKQPNIYTVGPDVCQQTNKI